MLWAIGSYKADRIYTQGANELRLSLLEDAAHLFPYVHEYRIGPAKLIIRDNQWYTPEEAIPKLEAARKHDPYSAYLTFWIDEYERRRNAR